MFYFTCDRSLNVAVKVIKVTICGHVRAESQPYDIMGSHDVISDV